MRILPIMTLGDLMFSYSPLFLTLFKNFGQNLKLNKKFGFTSAIFLAFLYRTGSIQNRGISMCHVGECHRPSAYTTLGYFYFSETRETDGKKSQNYKHCNIVLQIRKHNVTQLLSIEVTEVMQILLFELSQLNQILTKHSSFTTILAKFAFIQKTKRILGLFGPN